MSGKWGRKEEKKREKAIKETCGRIVTIHNLILGTIPSPLAGERLPSCFLR